VTLSAGCYQMWRDGAGAEHARARSWLQRVTRAVEAELAAQVRGRGWRPRTGRSVAWSPRASTTTGSCWSER
jgi:hypothetical protein